MILVEVRTLRLGRRLQLQAIAGTYTTETISYFGRKRAQLGSKTKLRSKRTLQVAFIRVSCRSIGWQLAKSQSSVCQLWYYVRDSTKEQPAESQHFKCMFWSCRAFGETLRIIHPDLEKNSLNAEPSIRRQSLFQQYMSSTHERSFTLL